MKSYIVLCFIIVLGIALIVGGAALWHLSSTTEFSRVAPPASQGQ